MSPRCSVTSFPIHNRSLTKNHFHTSLPNMHVDIVVWSTVIVIKRTSHIFIDMSVGICCIIVFLVYVYSRTNEDIRGRDRAHTPIDYGSLLSFLSIFLSKLIVIRICIHWVCLYPVQIENKYYSRCNGINKCLKMTIIFD